MSGIEILIDYHHGIYLPSYFARHYSSNWSGADVADLEILERGPEDESYWDAWDAVIRDSFHVDKDGKHWTLYQDGDLFAYCEEKMTEEEYKNFFGEER